VPACLASAPAANWEFIRMFVSLGSRATVRAWEEVVAAAAQPSLASGNLHNITNA